MSSVANMLAALDEDISPSPAAQQDSQGKLKGTGGGATPSQPVAGMAVLDVVKVGACLFIKGEDDARCDTDNCGFMWTAVEPFRFCMKTVETKCASCAKGKHKQVPAGAVKSNHLYIQALPGKGPKTRAAYLEPSIDASKFTPEIIQVIKEGEARIVPEWKRIFEAVNANPEWSTSDVIDAMRLTEQAVPFDRPPSTRKPPPRSQAKSTSPSAPFTPLARSTSESTLVDLTASERDDVLAGVANEWGSVNQSISDHDRKLEAMEARLNQLESATVIHSIWESIDVIKSQVVRVESSVRELYDESLSVKEDIFSLRASCEDFQTGLITRVRTVANRLNDVASRRVGGGSSSDAAEMRELKEEVQKMCSGVGGGSSSDAAEMRELKEEVQKMCSGFRERIAHLEIEIENAKLSARIDQDAVMIGGVTFQSEADCVAWVVENVTPVPCLVAGAGDRFIHRGLIRKWLKMNTRLRR
jgi:hypothetical protein